MFDDDLPELAPLVESALKTNPDGVPGPPARSTKPSEAQSSKSLPSLDDFDDDIPLAPVEPAQRKGLPVDLELPASGPALAGVLDDIVLTSSALDIGADPAGKKTSHSVAKYVERA